MLNKKEKEKLKKARTEFTFVSIKSSVLYTLNATLISFFITLLFQSVSNSPFILDIIMSLSISFLIYISMALLSFKSITLCSKLTFIYIKNKIKKLIIIILRKQ